MFRLLTLGSRITSALLPAALKSENLLAARNFLKPCSSFSTYFQLPVVNQNVSSTTSVVGSFLCQRSPLIQQERSVTKWSLKKGKRKSVKAVVQRFYRLEWGAWIRPMVGHGKRHWSKTAKRKIRGAQHVFCNSTQSTLLDKMVTKCWRRPRHYVDDIYAPYHKREEYVKTAVKPH